MPPLRPLTLLIVAHGKGRSSANFPEKVVENQNVMKVIPKLLM